MSTSRKEARGVSKESFEDLKKLFNKVLETHWVQHYYHFDYNIPAANLGSYTQVYKILELIVFLWSQVKNLPKKANYESPQKRKNEIKQICISLTRFCALFSDDFSGKAKSTDEECLEAIRIFETMRFDLDIQVNKSQYLETIFFNPGSFKQVYAIFEIIVYLEIYAGKFATYEDNILSEEKKDELHRINVSLCMLCLNLADNMSELNQASFLGGGTRAITRWTYAERLMIKRAIDLAKDKKELIRFLYSRCMIGNHPGLQELFLWKIFMLGADLNDKKEIKRIIFQ